MVYKTIYMYYMLSVTLNSTRSRSVISEVLTV